MSVAGQQITVLGAGVAGLAVARALALKGAEVTILETGMTVTVEPGIYLPGRGGVRIEDTLAVMDAGSRVLTEGVRDLRVVGV